VDIDAEYAAAVVVEGREVTLAGRHWPQDLATTGTGMR
jgi:hypothetical protein